VIDIEADKHFDNALVIAAFEGWNDAGEAASEAVSHLLVGWRATLIASVDPEDYYDFQVNRPHVGFDSEGGRELSWRTTSVWHCQAGPADRDVVLLTGIEPNLRWRTFCAELLDYLIGIGATTIVTLGALLADVPHTRPVQVTGSAPDPTTAARFGLTTSTYEGPTGITGVFADFCVQRGIPAFSFWAAVPHYVAQGPHPKAAVALLNRVEEILDIEVPLGTLPDQAEDWEVEVTDIAAQDEDISAYIQTLEETTEEEVPLRPASGDVLAAEFERYLRRRGPTEN
jgi:proteasome assembly chaperone (PAC2) family protein